MAQDLAAALKRAGADPAAFVGFYGEMGPRLLAFFARRTFDVEAAAELTAETFACAFEDRGRFRGSTDAEAAGWLFAIARHQLSRYIRRGIVERKALRRLGIQTPVVADDDHARIVELAGLAELRERLADALAQLPAPQHDALRLRIVDERPYSEVAATLGVSEQAARARVSRALRLLADAADPAAPTGVIR